MQIFRLATARMKTNQIPYVIFQITSQFFISIAPPVSVMTRKSSVTF